MMLTEFLLARIAKDETVALSASTRNGPSWVSKRGPALQPLAVAGPFYCYANSIEDTYLLDSAAAHVARWDPARVIAECETKRKIATEHQPDLGLPPGCIYCEWRAWPCETLRTLALPYADHPDYDEAWRP